MNGLTLIFLVALASYIVLQGWLIRRHIEHVRSHRDQVPAAFQKSIPLSAHQKAADYTQAKVRFGMNELLVGALLLLIWTLGGGLNLLDSAWRSAELPPLAKGIGFVISAYALMAVLEVPMSAYRTFVIEERFGFNKTTPKTFVTDILKQGALLLLIGTPLAALVLWLMLHGGELWWFYVWIAWIAFSLLMMWAYPTFIAPLFNKFRPLSDVALRARIENLLTRNGFSSQGIFVMDGSTRSTHGNAYFTGLGTNKRIVFFDTLMDELNSDEIEAVLAHELGHFKCKHITKRIVAMAAVSLFGLAFLGWLIDQPWFYSGLGIALPSAHAALVLFLLVSPVFAFFFQPLLAHISRKHEFEADDFAVKQAKASTLIQALVKLYKENANTLTPDPVYSAFHDSHPPAPVRVAHLSAKIG
ncbi:MAG: M48 family metallopeptidase [Gammaproteobacteria bacterium]|nr:M48 family metallopeptidase [Gammaproteobacteria bacterium]